MKSLKTIFLFSLVILLGTGASATQISQETVLSELSQDSFWAVTIYEGWRTREISLKLDDLLGKKDDGSIGDEELIWFYEKYDQRAHELYNRLPSASLELTLAVALYRMSLRDIKTSLKKENLTQKDIEIMNEAVTGLFKASLRLSALKSEKCD